MEEKQIIVGKPYNVRRTSNILALCVLAIGFISYSLVLLSAWKSFLNGEFPSYWNAWNNCLFGKGVYGSPFGGYVFATQTVIPAIAVAIAVLVVKWWLGSMKITVTDKRVYGQAAFGRRVDIPLDSISSVAISMLKGISVASSSGRIIFKFIKNNNEIHDEISKLLVNRQNRNEPQVSENKQEIPQNNAEEMRKYKALLDEGIITQEEFDAKKKQLLGL